MGRVLYWGEQSGRAGGGQQEWAEVQWAAPSRLQTCRTWFNVLRPPPPSPKLFFQFRLNKWMQIISPHTEHQKQASKEEGAPGFCSPCCDRKSAWNCWFVKMFKRETTLVSSSENAANVMFCFEHTSYILNITPYSTRKGIHTYIHTQKKKKSAGKASRPGEWVGRALASNPGQGVQRALRV